MKSINFFLLLLTVLILCSCNSIEKEENTTEANTSKIASGTISEPSLAHKVIDTFEDKFGVHEGKRRNHIDGFCFSGSLTLKDAGIKKYSKSKIFNEKPLSIMGRFSHKGGAKKDESQPGEYGMAFEVTLADGSIHNFSMNTLDFFPVKTPEGFLQLMQAKVSGKDEDFNQLKKDHPEFKNYKAHYKNKPKELKAYANHQFNSVNSFYFVNEDGLKTPVRWSFIPKNALNPIDASQKVDLFDETQKALAVQKSLTWEMVVSIANDGDDVEDASVQWSGEHKTIVAATLTIDQIMKKGNCDDTNFDPLRLQKGIQPSNDPILKFRSPAYATSFARRFGENKKKGK